MFFTLFKPFFKKYFMFCKKKLLLYFNRTYICIFIFDKYTLHFLCCDVFDFFFFKNLNCRNLNCPNLNSPALIVNNIVLYISLEQFAYKL